MPVIQILSTGGADGRIRVIVDGNQLLLQPPELLQPRVLPNNTIRFCNEERAADLPITPSLLSDISVDGQVPSTVAELNTLLAAVFPAMPDAPSDGGGSSYLVKTYAEIVTLIAANGLEPGSLYKISDRGDRGLFFQAVSVNKLANNGVRLMLCPSFYGTGSNGGNTWIGVWSIQKTVNSGDLSIWGGLVWENLTGSIGTSINDISLDETNWVIIPKASFSNNEYVELEFGCRFDIVNDWVELQWDGSRNVFGMDFQTETNYYEFGFNPCDVSDWNLTDQSGTRYLHNNQCIGVWNNTNSLIYGNLIVDGFIRKNTNNGSIYLNRNTTYIEGNSNNGDISYNANGIDILNNSNNGSIFSNTNLGDIHNNSNGGDIYINSNNAGISNNSNGGSINDNKNAGRIRQNSNTGVISFNSNNGEISNIGAANGDIKNNVNNGDILTTTTGDITDTVVNK